MTLEAVQSLFSGNLAEILFVQELCHARTFEFLSSQLRPYGLIPFTPALSDLNYTYILLIQAAHATKVSVRMRDIASFLFEDAEGAEDLWGVSPKWSGTTRCAMEYARQI